MRRRPADHATDAQLRHVSRLLRETEMFDRLLRRIAPNFEGNLIDWTFYDADRWTKETLTFRMAAKVITLIEDERYDEAGAFLHDLGMPIR